jgi:ATP-dependent protease HslVU (ClpYQ) ATPase subunit
MNAKQMSAALKAFGTLLDGSEALALAKFSQVFNGMGDVKATAVAAQVAKNWKAEGREPKRPAELERAVRRIHDVVVTMGARTQAGVFAKVLPMLAGNESQDVDSFVRDVIAARVKKTPAELAARLAQKLTEAANDRRRFDALLSDYEGRCKPGELKAIAERFMGHAVVGKKDKQAVVKAIRNWQREGELNRYSHTSQAKAAL